MFLCLGVVWGDVVDLLSNAKYFLISCLEALSPVTLPSPVPPLPRHILPGPLQMPLESHPAFPNLLYKEHSVFSALSPLSLINQFPIFLTSNNGQSLTF